MAVHRLVVSEIVRHCQALPTAVEDVAVREATAR